MSSHPSSSLVLRITDKGEEEDMSMHVSMYMDNAALKSKTTTISAEVMK